MVSSMDESDEEKYSVYTSESEDRNVKAEEMFIHELYGNVALSASWSIIN